MKFFNVGRECGISFSNLIFLSGATEAFYLIDFYSVMRPVSTLNDLEMFSNLICIFFLFLQINSSDEFEPAMMDSILVQV
jgi:hypothetical protein